MTNPETVNATQSQEHGENRDEINLALYEAIRRRILQTKFPRRRIDEEELLHAVFAHLFDQSLPALNGHTITRLLDRNIQHTIRDFKMAQRPSLDVEEFGPDFGPVYDEPEWSEEAEFERAFEKFCDTQPEPRRTIFLCSRTHSRNDIAKSVGLSRQEIGRVLKLMPEKFRLFLKKYKD